jgi:hypothetical protein
MQANDTYKPSALLWAKYSRSISRGWAGSFILRHQYNLSETRSTLQENTRLEVPHAFLDETIRCLRGYVHRMKKELVFNHDEVDMSKWEDRKPKKVIILKTIAEETVHHRVSRGVKHISIIAYITAIGESLTPYIVTSQDFEPFRKRLMRQGVRMDVDFVLKQRSNRTWIQIFALSMWILSMSNNSPGYGGQKNLKHMERSFWWTIAQVTYLMTLVLFSPGKSENHYICPHTIHIFQTLDVVLFGTLKKHATGLTTLGRNKRPPHS